MLIHMWQPSSSWRFCQMQCICSDINMSNYADDNCISFAGIYIDLIEDTLNKEIIILLEWLKNSLAANPTKFQTIFVHSNSIKDTELIVFFKRFISPHTYKVQYSALFWLMTSNNLTS